ncbi:hypothetical protein AYO21_11396 [Fonsecaea monophora]|uniref:DUF7924 domain-containing protein n=1 Tax=Fonsecaea monophora TaxID=254056 RepID=A0A177ER07_9EURO|nr:hypothetical protein AYO21_11396 [Fonsecaea monophora]OAG34444.1 hypothetical protein AYO21_11396 [Fonsecaea monophora]
MSVPDGSLPAKNRRRNTLRSPRRVQDTPSSLRRKKRTSEAEEYQWPTTGFWNRLSKVHLTGAALREFDCRTLRAGVPVPTPQLNDDISRPRTKSVVRFALRGGPDLTHIRGYASLADQDDTMTRHSAGRTRPPASADKGTTCKSMTAHDSNFGQALIDAGINQPSRTIQPSNVGDIRTDMAKRRPSLSPPRFNDKDFADFQDLCDLVSDEATTRAQVMSIIAGKPRKDHYNAAGREFSHLEPFADELPRPKPDLYDGAFPRQIDLKIRHDLGGHIVPSNDTSLPAAPNFFLEVKGESGRADVARRQARHDGAVGARAMHSLQNYKSDEIKYDGNAYSYSAVYLQGGAVLRLYSHHLTAPRAPGQPVECHMTQLRGYELSDSIETFGTGVTSFRNLRDRAKTVRDDFISHANQIARSAPVDNPSTTLADSCTSLQSTQEDEFDASVDEPAAKRAKCATSEHSSAVSEQGLKDGQSRRQTKPVRKVLPNKYTRRLRPRQ